MSRQRIGKGGACVSDGTQSYCGEDWGLRTMAAMALLLTPLVHLGKSANSVASPVSSHSACMPPSPATRCRFSGCRARQPITLHSWASTAGLRHLRAWRTSGATAPESMMGTRAASCSAKCAEWEETKERRGREGEWEGGREGG